MGGQHALVGEGPGGQHRLTGAGPGGQHMLASEATPTDLGHYTASSSTVTFTSLPHSYDMSYSVNWNFAGGTRRFIKVRIQKDDLTSISTGNDALTPPGGAPGSGTISGTVPTGWHLYDVADDYGETVYSLV